ncbi:hypothetical protein J2T22_004084 [Pseudarthrobacter defluvii]|uniref:Uncharacterized protein n=1 Tax=Pseudarthrobacter defluvii TaxID=410837 RepID=A0ABT9UMK1_9MICC|nr:hypothetical protein [Pseudarthrobacter defluvii]MDQ0120874.1 hypothetical protein [Pseudarthrobacter defluvii]
MTHNKIKTCANFTSARMALQNQLRRLQQKRGLGRMLLKEPVRWHKVSLAAFFSQITA